MFRKLLQRYSSSRPARRIDSNGNDYLFRVYLWHWRGWRFYLHKFVASDGDRWLHDHPFNALSIILLGSYSEKILTGFDCPGVQTITRRRRWFNFVGANKFHQISGINQETWTLFIHAPHRKQWGFFEPHPDYTAYHNPFDQAKSNGTFWWLSPETKTLAELETR